MFDGDVWWWLMMILMGLLANNLIMMYHGDMLEYTQQSKICWTTWVCFAGDLSHFPNVKSITWEISTFVFSREGGPLFANPRRSSNIMWLINENALRHVTDTLW